MVASTSQANFQDSISLPLLPVAPTPPPSVSDDFSNPASGWPISNDGVANLAYLDGNYQILMEQAGYDEHAGHGYVASDFHLDIDVWSNSAVLGGYGVYYGSGSTGFFDLELFPQSNTWVLQRYFTSNSQWQTAWSGTSPAIAPGTALNHLTVIRSGSTTTLYLNSQYIGQDNDNTFGTGYIGLAASSNVANFDARFDNFYLAFGATAVVAPSIRSSEPRLLSTDGLGHFRLPAKSSTVGVR